MKKHLMIYPYSETIKNFKSSKDKFLVKGLRYGRKLSDRFFTLCMSFYASINLGYFFWDININKKYKKISISKMSKKNLILFFNKFLKNEAQFFFNTNTEIISHYPKKIHVFRYENLSFELKKILFKLKIKKVRIPINKIYFKKSNIKKDKKRIIDRSARKNILKYGKFFFDRFCFLK